MESSNVNTETHRPTAPSGGGGPTFVGASLAWALAVGVLAGLAEVVWSYALPSFSPQWRAVLPSDWLGFAEFLAIAAATDTLLTLVGAILLLGALCTAVTIWPLTRGRCAAAAPWLILGGAACYLYVGWLTLFVLLPHDRGKLSYQATLWGGVSALLLLAWLISTSVRKLSRRTRAAGPVAFLGAFALMLGIAAPAFTNYSRQLPAPPEIESSALSRRPNVLLVTLDTTRMDYLGCYGHPWIQTPAIDAVARDGFVFEAAISQAPSTAPSHCSIMASVYPFDHGAENGKPMATGLVTLADVFRANGYETAAFTSSTTTRSINSGLQQGFDLYVDSLVPWSAAFSRDDFQNLILFYVLGIAQDSQIPADVVTERALSWLKQRADRPFFAWLHFFDPHAPYGQAPPYRDMYKGKISDGAPLASDRERYAEDITYMDAQLGRFIDELKRRGLYDDCVIVLAADHGEGFGEMHGDVRDIKHGRYLYDTTQHVPLIIKPPVGAGAGRRVAPQVELIDIAPTLLEWLGMTPQTGFKGHSLVALASGGEAPSREAHAFNVIDIHQPGGVIFAQQMAIRTPKWKYITVPRIEQRELFDLEQDPRESTNIALAQHEVADERHARIMPFWKAELDNAGDPRQRLAPALTRQLEALGYLGGGTDEASEPEPEPDSEPTSQPAPG